MCGVDPQRQAATSAGMPPTAPGVASERFEVKIAVGSHLTDKKRYEAPGGLADFQGKHTHLEKAGHFVSASKIWTPQGPLALL